MISGSGTSAHNIGFSTNVPLELLERFPAASTVTKQTTNDNITTKTNLFI
jgi:hypothetical protein